MMAGHIMEKTVAALVAPGKGLLAADESFATIAKRFEAINLPSTEEYRRAYRELLFTAPGIERYLSGVILFDETIHQQASDGTPFPVLLTRRGILPGIKVDTGTVSLPFFPEEKITEGLDGLRERFAEYRNLGARFSKWRAVIRISEHTPTQSCLDANAQTLARYAALSQEAGLVPIVEPEVLMEGNHTLERCAEVTEQTLFTLFQALYDARVAFEMMLLKANMALPGTDSSHQVSVQDVAEATLRCLRHAVPAAVPGVVFLSGGQSDLAATQHLNALNQLDDAPWQLGFSFARALQRPALQAWEGKAENRSVAQQALLHRAKCNGVARTGQYSSEMESQYP